jgi:hypothetical protein
MEIISIGARVTPAIRITPLKKLSPPVSELNDVDNVDKISSEDNDHSTPLENSKEILKSPGNSEEELQQFTNITPETCIKLPKNVSLPHFVFNHVDNVDNVDTNFSLDDAIDAVADKLMKAKAAIDGAIDVCAESPAVLFDDEFREALQYLYDNNEGEYHEARCRIKMSKPSGVRMSAIDNIIGCPSNGTVDSSVASELIALCLEHGELYHDGAADKNFLCTSGQMLNIETKAFIDWLSMSFYNATRIDEDGYGKSASEQHIKQARFTLAGMAKDKGIKQPVYLRAATASNGNYIHLGDGTNKAIEITSTGWCVTDDAPVKFWQSSSMQHLPTPIVGGDVDLLWKYVNVNESDRLLVLAWLLESFRPSTPFLVLAISGTQGCAKSSSQDKIRQLVDNNSVNLRAAPKTIEDIFVSAGVNWVVSFENLSHLTPAMQDALCTLATGGGFASRKFFTNDEENIIAVKRPVIINSIPNVITAQDLTDRAIHVEAPRIGYIEEAEINTAWVVDKPIIFGGLMDLFVATLAGLDKVKLVKPPRMADFTRLGESMAQSLGHDDGHFTALYMANRLDGLSRSIEASPIAVALTELVDGHRGSLQVFHGTAKRLLDTLASKRESDQRDGWVKSARGLTESIKRQQPALKEIGIDVSFGRKVERLGNERGYFVTITKTGNYSPNDYESAKSGDDI